MNSLFVTRECRLYALRELAKRAGVSPEFFRSWRIDWSADEMIVFLDSKARATVRFPSSPPVATAELLRRKVARLGWMANPSTSVYEEVREFVVPFASEGETEVKPLFVREKDAISCSLDLLASIALTLARGEELTANAKDKHGRFPISASQAYQGAFIDRPIVDEYGFAFEQAIAAAVPGWRARPRKLRVLVSHDVDHVGIPFNFRQTIGHVLRHRNLAAATHDVLSLVSHSEPAYLALVMWMAEMEIVRGLDCEVYWKASGKGKFDSGYDISTPAICKVVRNLRSRGIRQGIHPGYNTFRNAQLICGEAKRFSKVLGEEVLDGRQHYLRWDHETWLHYEAAGLLCDSTIGYADDVGFRAGTCVPYRPWLFSLNRESAVVEIPLLVMDQALLDMSIADAMQMVSRLIARCRNVGGVFTLLWHNSNAVARRHRRLYAAILDRLAAERPARLPPSRVLQSEFLDLPSCQGVMRREVSNADSFRLGA
ncbi:MAG TPA: polysaccharide deacetylase family protein [Terriglobales bacterium]|nr:polysaccharide deacetylase family protein [Terriglobales bacterium]